MTTHRAVKQSFVITEKLFFLTSSAVQKGLPVLLASEVVDSGPERSLMGGRRVRTLSGAGLMQCLPFLLVLKTSTAKEIGSREGSKVQLEMSLGTAA